ncbi:hypothetical protein E3H11_21820 [Bradyrhizobium brasilense]|nr:hypothetical protein [Bradyrhizobium brasilense]
MQGQRPAVHRTPSWPGLTRPSTPFLQAVIEDVDARVKPGHDEQSGVVNSPAGRRSAAGKPRRRCRRRAAASGI